ncbi:hypothetical protein LZC95_10030 [Pendulispora brunnea]|uniref:Uncharacterized protein n=1 Tax=Pendulispora brunnea TaxID=2905690 RepID=A0ABZ2KEP8_9BACT
MKRGTALLAGVLGMWARTAAAADPPLCTTLSNPLVIFSGDTQEPLLKAMGRKLRDSATSPMTVIYQTGGTCTVQEYMYGHKNIPQKTVLSYMPSTAENKDWKTSDPPLQCTVPDGIGLPIDLGIGATYLSSCDTSPPPSDMRLVEGPIQGYGFAVPKASSQRAITAEEGYFAFGGFGPQGHALPWVDDQFFYIRKTTKSTLLTLAAALGIPAPRMKGTQFEKSSEVLAALTGSAAAANPDKAIGLLGTEIYDANRDKVTLLAFQAAKQHYAYYPDSTATSFDKRNLRDGHYFPWAPTIYIEPIGATGGPLLPRARLFLDLVMGRATLPDVDGLAVVIDKGLVPECAMKVMRSSDGGDLSLYDDPEPCGCYYESKVPNGSTSCTACTDTCASGTCRHGYCEAR